VSELLAESVRSLIAEVDSDPGDSLLSRTSGGASRGTWFVTADRSKLEIARPG
jgi:ABC-type antimicrobial peptide transport system ATPase subunit